MFTVNIVMLCCLYPLLPILYFILRNEIKPKKNLRIGVTLPYAHLLDDEVERICAGYKKRLRTCALLLMPWPLFCFLLPGFSLGLTLQLMWLLLCIIVMHLPYFRAHKELKTYKRSQNWGNDGQKVVVDLTASARMEQSEKRIRFLPPILIGCIPLVYCLFYGAQPGWGPFILTYGTMALLAPLFLLIHGIMFRQRTEVVSHDFRLNTAITAIRRKYWTKSLLFSAYLTAIYTLILWGTMEEWFSLLVFLLSTVIYIILLLIVMMRAEFACRQSQERLSRQAAGDALMDEDENWILGMFYQNANDRRTMVANRTGLGTTVNLARPGGKAIMIFALVALLMLPLMCVWCIAEEYTPLQAELEGNALVVQHLSRTEIPLYKVTGVSLLSELPSARRVVGSGMEHLLKGSFQVEGYGMCTLSLDPTAPPFIAVHAEEKIYLVNCGQDQDATYTLYEKLVEALK